MATKRRGRIALIIAMFAMGCSATVAVGTSLDVPGPDGCKMFAQEPYTVIKPQGIVASAQLSCFTKQRVAGKVVLWESHGSRHEWRPIDAARASRGHSTVVEPHLVRICRTGETHLYAVSAVGEVNGKRPLVRVPRSQGTQAKLKCPPPYVEHRAFGRGPR